MSLIIIGREINGAREFGKRAIVILQLDVGLTQLIVRLGEARIDLDGIGILNRRFAEFPFVAVAVAALQKLLLLYVGIAIAADE